MPGNSKRTGAVRKRAGGNPTAGSGGRRKRGLEGKGPTPKAAERPAHKAYARPGTTPEAGRRASKPTGGRRQTTADWVVGRNAVVEALEAHVPVTALYIAEHTVRDDRVREAFRLAADRNLSILEVSRHSLDSMTDGPSHQGLAMKVPLYSYADPDELAESAAADGSPGLLVALDSVTDPRNLGAVVRSAAAFGADGVVVPQRRAAGMTASAWKTSAGAAARVPVARATNLTRQLEAYKRRGFTIAGLDAAGTVDIGELDAATDSLVLVVGSEDKGLARLVRESCDVLVRIPIAATTESLNAGVAAGIALYEIDRTRRLRGS